MEVLNEFTSKKPSKYGNFKEFGDYWEVYLLKKGRWHTDTFGWVRLTDYENPRYWFLKRDQGVPAQKKLVEKWIETSKDPEKSKKRKETIEEWVFPPEFLEWNTKTRWSPSLGQRIDADFSNV